MSTVLRMSSSIEDSDKWPDLTEEFKNMCSQLDLGELIHDPGFGLYEAMSAFEMMDPKMDSGMITMQTSRSMPKTLVSCIDSGELKSDGFSHRELCSLFDGTFCAIITWIEGSSMAQTVFANLYLHNPSLVEHRILKAFLIASLKLVDKIRELIGQTNVYEEEHFQSVTYGFQLADDVSSLRATGMLKEAEDELSKCIRSLKSRADDDSTTEMEEVQQVLARLRLLKGLYLLILNIRYEGMTIIE